MLDVNCIEVYFAAPDTVTDSGLLEQYASLLSADEADRWRRFVFPADRHVFLVSHALLRVALSRHADVPPARWAFTKNAYGRLEIAAPAAGGELSFNLSHTKGLATVAIAGGRRVGVDVEGLARPMPEEVLDSVFSPGEIRALRSLPQGKDRERFFHLWTLKEAYAKARGMGLSLPFPKITFDLDSPPPIVAAFGPEVGDDGSRWSFALLRPTPEHCLAVAFEALRDERLRIRTTELVPFA